jgi:hypothetical protein
MSLIHRCDRCKCDFLYSNELVKVSIGVDVDIEECWLNRNDMLLPYFADLCRDCVVVALLALKPPTEKNKAAT